ncbi:metallopeptidase family protein [Streptomyces sp. 147326]
MTHKPLLTPLTGLDPRSDKVSYGCSCVHEIAHHFGIDDDRLHAPGYG